MDERETSAMTEASGLVTDPAGAAATSGTRSSHPLASIPGDSQRTWRSGCARSPWRPHSRRFLPRSCLRCGWRAGA